MSNENKEIENVSNIEERKSIHVSKPLHDSLRIAAIGLDKPVGRLLDEIVASWLKNNKK